MGLYGDLPQARNASASATPETATTWASAKPTAAPFRKPPSILAPPAALLRAGRGGGRGAPTPGRGPPRTPSSDTPTAAATPGPAGPGGFNILAQAAGAGGAVVEEYDPARPNEYEVVLREREARKQEALAEEERQARRREVQREQEERQRAEQEAAERRAASAAAASSSAPAAGLGAGGGAGADEARARALNISADEAWMRRAALSGRMPAKPPPPAGGPPDAGGDDGGAAAAKGMNLAKNLLQKMGWREGEGLGRNRQGISAPLVAQKTDRRGGVIVPAAPAPGPMPQQEEPAEKRPRGATWQGTPTRVICLRNMVGPGEVDEDLEEEVGQEALKYGQVTSVLIFEVTTPGWPPEEAVRIFLQFDRSESATKALVDFQGRYFGGRQVRAAFFDEARFDRSDLAPQAGEFGA